jgi:transposase
MREGGQVEVAIGIDSHKGTLAAAAVDTLGRVLGVREFTNDPKGHQAFLRWMREQGSPRKIGIEGSLHYGAALSQRLLAEGEDVREVPPSLTHLERRRRQKGKSDQVDAVAIARVVAGEETLPPAGRLALFSDLKLLVDYRDQLVRPAPRWSTASMPTWLSSIPATSGVVPNLRAKRHVGKARSLVGRDRSVRGELVRRRLGDVLRLEEQIAEADRRIADKLREADTTLTQIRGVGPFIAAKILGEVGQVSRVRSKASFASLSGTAPLVASSGLTHRHRLNRGGNRQVKPSGGEGNTVRTQTSQARWSA